MNLFTTKIAQAGTGFVICYSASNASIDFQDIECRVSRTYNKKGLTVYDVDVSDVDTSLHQDVIEEAYDFFEEHHSSSLCKVSQITKNDTFRLIFINNRWHSTIREHLPAPGAVIECEPDFYWYPKDLISVSFVLQKTGHVASEETMYLHLIDEMFADKFRFEDVELMERYSDSSDIINLNYKIRI